MQKQLFTFFALIAAAACGDDGHAVQPDGSVTPPIVDAPVTPPACTPSTLRTDLTWYGTNAADLTTWLSSKGCLSAGYDKTKKPVALFDWDNTISKNDFGDAFTFYLIQNNKILQPPNQDWKLTSAYMTDAGAAALTAACGTTIAAGQPLPTGTTNTACGQEILNMYSNNATTAAAPTPGAVAFTGQNVRWMEPTYAWTAQLAAGYTHAEVKAMATAAITPQLAAAQGTVQTIAGVAGQNGWLRIYDQTKDLISVAQSQGYDVWIITASPQDVIEAFSPMVNIAADHVIGIRSKTDSANKLTYKFEGCGAAADDNQSMISYIQGKRCWVNKVVYGDTTAAAMQRRPDGQRQVFAAGDSDTDIEFLRDATYRLVINRNKTELMCHAYYNSNDGWRINPMFILPKGMKTSQYTCSTTCTNGLGTPCMDDANNVIAPQTDSVH